MFTIRTFASASLTVFLVMGVHARDSKDQPTLEKTKSSANRIERPVYSLPETGDMTLAARQSSSQGSSAGSRKVYEDKSDADVTSANRSKLPDQKIKQGSHKGSRSGSGRQHGRRGK